MERKTIKFCETENIPDFGGEECRFTNVKEVYVQINGAKVGKIDYQTCIHKDAEYDSADFILFKKSGKSGLLTCNFEKGSFDESISKFKEIVKLYIKSLG